MIRNRLTLLASLCLVAAAIPAKATAGPPQPEVPAYAPPALQVTTVDLAIAPTFDIVTSNFVVMRVSAVDSSGHRLLRIATARVSIPSTLLRNPGGFAEATDRLRNSDRRQRHTRRALRVQYATGKLTDRNRFT